MPYEKITQVAGTLIPQESRTLRSIQLVTLAPSKSETKYLKVKKGQSIIWLKVKGQRKSKSNFHQKNDLLSV
jgi:hypothetical protein